MCPVIFAEQNHTAMSTPANFNGKKPMIDPKNVAMLLIDHQSSLFQLVEDMPARVLRENVTALAKVASLAKIPVITSASAPQGPNGPMIPEIHKYAPHAKYVARHGELSAWDSADFVAAVKATGKKQLIIAGTLTNVCMAFPAIQAVADGYQVFAVFDASGASSRMAYEITLARLVQAGVVPIDTGGCVAELEATLNRPDVNEWGMATAHIYPKYPLLYEAYLKAQDVVRNNEVLDSEKV